MITPKERAFLKAQIHSKKPTLRIGKDGIKDETLEAIDLYLNKNELMKIQILNNSDTDIMELFNILEDELNVEFLSSMGHILSIYRRSDNNLYLK